MINDIPQIKAEKVHYAYGLHNNDISSFLTPS